MLKKREEHASSSMTAVARSAWTNMKFKFAPTKTIEAFFYVQVEYGRVLIPVFTSNSLSLFKRLPFLPRNGEARCFALG
jgi:hypothetical protein